MVTIKKKLKKKQQR